VQNSCNQVDFGKWQLLSAKLKDHKFSLHFYFNYIDTSFNLRVSVGMPNSVIRDGPWPRAVLWTCLVIDMSSGQSGSWIFIRESLDLGTGRDSRKMDVQMRKSRSREVKSVACGQWTAGLLSYSLLP
jgi:hypothetical protein